MKYIDNTSSGSNITLKKDGVVVGETRVLNFMGVDVNVIEGTGEVIIQIPPSAYSPYFNDSGALISDITVVNRLVSNPTTEGSPFKLGSWIAGSTRPCFNSSSLVYQCNDFSINNDTNTTIKVEIFDADGSTVIASNTQTITGNIDDTTENIRIEIYDFATESDKFKAKFRTTIGINSILSEGGRFSVNITHDNATEGVKTKSQNNIFYDSNPINPTINNPTISENTPSIIYLSGISFYGVGSIWNVGVANISNINNRSYPANFINILSTEFGIATMNIQGANLNDWDTFYNNTGASYYNDTIETTTTNYYNKGDLKIQARWIDWVTNSYQDSLTLSALVSTYTNNATRIYEDFRNETRRLKLDYTSGWDSEQSLETYETGNGLQVIGSRLIYPQENFTSYNPNTVNQKDYSSLAGNRIWISNFYQDSVNNSNGIFRFSDHNITEQKLTDQDILIEISLDKTNWYNCNLDYLGGALSHGSGCRVETDTYYMTNNQLKFTLGTFFTDASSDWGIWYRITYKDNVTGKANYLGILEITDWV